MDYCKNIVQKKEKLGPLDPNIVIVTFIGLYGLTGLLIVYTKIFEMGIKYIKQMKNIEKKDNLQWIYLNFILII